MESSPQRILIVEDDEDSAVLLTSMLARVDGGAFTAKSVSTLAAALENAKGGDIDAIVLDLNLPDSQGTATVAAVRRENRHVPIVVVSGHGDDPGVFDALRNGAQDYLVKDGLQPDVLAGAIRCAMERSRGERMRIEEAELLRAERMESLSVLAGGLAHEFNNLLMVIIGNADLAAVDVGQSLPAQNSIRAIKDASLRAAELCNQLLAYSGRGRFVFEPVNLSKAIRDMGELIRVSVPKKVKVCFDLPDALPHVDGDVAQLRRVVVGLVANAAEAIDDAKGTISLVTGAREFDSEELIGAVAHPALEAGKYVFLETRDTGCGMNKETRQRVLDPFFTTKSDGRGMGLPAVLGVLRGHGAGMKISSIPDEGTCVTLLFPCTGSYPRTEGGLRQLAEQMGGGTVLVVDDEEEVLALAARMVEHLGFRVLTAHDGLEAVDVFRRHANEISLVILDLTMPGLDGIEALDAIHRIRGDARILLSSGYTRGSLAGALNGRSVVGFLHKPYELNALREKLVEVLGGSSAAQRGKNP